MFKLNGKTLQQDRAFTHDGIQYPSNWLRLSSADEKAALGIVWEPAPPRADDRFFWNGDIKLPRELEDREEFDEDGNPLYVKVLDNSDPDNPVMVDSTERLVTKGLKSQFIAQIKDTAGKILAKSDWMVIRAAELPQQKPLNQDVKTMRVLIRGESDRLEALIKQATTIEMLQAVMADQNWPEE